MLRLLASFPDQTSLDLPLLHLLAKMGELRSRFAGRCALVL